MLIGFIASKATVISVRLLKGILSGAVEVKQARRASKALRARATGQACTEQDLIYPGAVAAPEKTIDVCCTLREWEQMEKGHFDPVVLSRGERREKARKKIEARMAAERP